MSGQCNSPCATITERRQGMMNKFQGMIDNYDNAPFRETMRCPPATLREFPTLVERNQLLACYPVCPPPCPAPCPPMCSPCPPPMCVPCPAPCPAPCPPVSHSSGQGGGHGSSAYNQCMDRMQSEDDKRARFQATLDQMPSIVSNQVMEYRPASGDKRRNPNSSVPGTTFVNAEEYFQQQRGHNEQGGRKGPSDSRELRGGVLYTGCECVKRNGLQHDCRRSECMGSPQCLTKPWPDCKPSGGSGMKSAPPRQSNYPDVPERCNAPRPRSRGPPVKDHEHRAGITCEQCEPPLKRQKPTYIPQPTVNCPKPKMNHYPTSRIPPLHTELKGGQLLNRCDCNHRNGLQDECKLHDCGIPECLFVPDPECIPSGGRGPQGRANGL